MEIFGQLDIFCPSEESPENKKKIRSIDISIVEKGSQIY